MASKRSSETQLQDDIKRQKTYELEASEEKKNVQAAAEFWAVMRHTHGFQNQSAPVNEVTTSTEPGTSSRQQAEASPKNHRNPKRRRGPDNEYTEPTTTMTPLGDIDTLKDTPTNQPDTKRCIQVGRETYAVTSQPGTSYTFETGIDTGTFQGQRPQPVTTPVCDDYDSILVIDSSEPRMQPTTTTNTKKTNRTPHGKHAKAQAGAWHRR